MIEISFNMYLTETWISAIIYYAEIICARLGEDKQLLSLERSDSFESEV